MPPQYFFGARYLWTHDQTKDKKESSKVPLACVCVIVCLCLCFQVCHALRMFVCCVAITLSG